ncbi:MAG TPA: hypothetical protein VMU54_10390 [Planctomycetota bacterium]|nr:hypothetical protein [Planctomycetota bacterium]
METHLVNSQMLSRKDVRAWFWDGQAEFSGPCLAIADNGLLFRAEVKGAPDFPGLRNSLRGKKIKIELSSPKTRGEVKIDIREVAVVSAAKSIISISATFAEPPAPGLLSALLSPVITIVPKKK